MGGDRAPDEVVAGAVAAARDFNVTVLLVGDENAIRRCLPAAMRSGTLPHNIEIHPASQVVEMGESPSQAHRTKKDSSIAVATRLHRDGKADAVLSAGNTGAAATSALLTLKKIAGIDRPGIATVFPTSRNPLVLLDAGANVDCRPRHLAEFAIMGAAYARTVKGIIPGTTHSLAPGQLPKVGLLSIGEEASKGNDLTKSAYKLLEENAAKGNYVFYGNVEGRDIGLGTVEVVVCDGFVGNVVLKVAEGLAKMISGALREALTTDLRSKAGALLLRPSLRNFKKRMDYAEYGGAVLLGVNGVCIICHGSSDWRSIHSAIRIAKQTVAANIVETIRAAAEQIGEGEGGLNGMNGEDDTSHPNGTSQENNGENGDAPQKKTKTRKSSKS
ncbi:MAG: phosphate acyltransferase PlsX [Abitibacteriaceae bacterium]|nr:phosphate acyltransferase PlsX [Abditibacteriaceae bacterium]